MKKKASSFENDSLLVFERLLQGYKRGSETIAWESNMDELMDKLTHLPTDPFSVKLMGLFDYHYLALKENIDCIINRSIKLREVEKDTERFVTIDERYFSLPFLAANTYLKRLEVYNHEGDICYRVIGKLRFNFRKLFTKSKFSDLFWVKETSIEYHKLELYYYSPLVDLTTTDSKKYYHFFCDYYGKIQLTNYLAAKDKIASAPLDEIKQIPQALEQILKLSNSQQVLWAFFMFKLMGLDLKENLDASILARFLLIINKSNPSDYRNTYFYKLANKAPFIKDNKKLIADLKIVKTHFQLSNLPTTEIEKVIFKLIPSC
ncbi:hypothetical protein [Saccharicrinis aurantiacus]|uniref:hypothetical protein n=1 Tax=Saccharicrinis aurantiacus TaxID=1849719 RepID=UPI0009502370|nr:hypothetical protein [Saccharicrinis aurantiacus]